MTNIAVVGCGTGNIHSVVAGIKRAQPAATLQVTDEAAVIAAADKVIFPGDGNFGACMREIDARGLRQALCAAAREKPFLGICVGMQVLCRASEEAEEAGLGVLDATVQRLPAQAGLKIPHMGWNTSRQRQPHPLIAGIDDDEYFYFIHSYYVPLGEWTLITCDYGTTFSAVVASGQLIATQFHPEKSGRYGIRLLENFLNQDAV